MDLIERFRYIMKLKDLSASAFADEIGVQRSSVSHILSGRNKPSLEFIQKVISKYPKVDAAWLINGTSASHIKDKISIKANSNDGSEAISEDLTDKKQVDQKKTEGNVLKKPNKSIEKVLVFYSDKTFEEFHP